MRRFSLAEIRRATNNFDESLIISTGAFGRIYRAHGSVSGSIFRLTLRSTNARIIEMKVEVLTEARHRNILSVIGYCSEKEEKILVYEDAPLRTLGDYLHGDRANEYNLSWAQRLKICIGTARGLDYLHSVTSIENGVIHGDVKSENILLDENLVAKIGGFARRFGYEEDESTSLIGIMNRSADVYRFGVVLFEVLSGSREGRLDPIIDPRLFGEVVREDEFVNLAEQCLDENLEKRPKMREVVSRLEGLLKAWELNRGNVNGAGPSNYRHDQVSEIEESNYIKDSNYSHDRGDSMVEEKNDAFREEAGTTQSARKITFRMKMSRRKIAFRRKMSWYLYRLLSGMKLGKCMQLSPSQENFSDLPEVEEWDAGEIHWCDKELPEKPYCPILVKLFLQSHNISVIPLKFFHQMPNLQILDLSKTRIDYLPPSVSKLVALKELYMRDCVNMMELPTEIGALKSLRVFDSEGTQLIYLPKEMGMLNKLESLKVSLYQQAHLYLKSRQISEIISAAMLLKFSRLKVLSIDVGPDCDWWEIAATHIVEMLSELKNLHTLKFYFPSAELLDRFTATQHSVYPLPSHFRLIVGRYEHCIVSRAPYEVEEVFMKLDKCIKYTNGWGTSDGIAKALKHASALFLELDWDIQSLSIFEMETLKSCLLVECHGMQSIVNGSEFHEEEDNRGVLGSLEYLSIHVMQNLDCIWRGPFRDGSLCGLKTLEINACFELTTLFTKELLYGLTNLEHLTVMDCPKLDSLVSLGSDYPESDHFLPKLKRLCLLDMPELFSISRGICIAPELERLVIYNCPMLRVLSTKEVSSMKIEAVNGCIEWWDALEWSSGRPDYLAHVFVPVARHKGLIDEFTTDVLLLQQQLM